MTNEQAIEIAMNAVDEAVSKGRPLLYRIPPFDEVVRVPLEGNIRLYEEEAFNSCDYEYPNGDAVRFWIKNDYEAVTVLLPCEN